MGTRHTRERLFEVMIKVDPDFKENLLLKEYFENPQKFENVVNEIDDVDDGHDEEQQEITPEEQQKAQELNKKAETAVESDDDINKPVVDDSIKGLDFTVTVPTYKKRLADQNIESLRKLARRLRIPEPEVTEGAVYQKRITEPCEIPPCDHYLIDVYDLNIGTYKTSFYIYKESGNSVRRFFILGEYFYGFTGNKLVRYDLKNML